MNALRANVQALPVNLGRSGNLHGAKEAEIGIILPEDGINRQLDDSPQQGIVVRTRP